MSNIENRRCILGGKEVSPDQLFCLKTTCMICEDGKWQETNKIWVL
ncbi:MAG: hypothetical protein AAGU11_14980 [Syntrophobacteraceae bacterium]